MLPVWTLFIKWYTRDHCQIITSGSLRQIDTCHIQDSSMFVYPIDL